MDVRIAKKAPGFHKPGLLEREPSLFRRYFTQIMLDDERLKGEVLDAGCGVVGPSNEDTARLYSAIGTLDGVDPAPPSQEHDPDTWYRRRWTGLPHQVDLPSGAYDAVISVNVLEHVDDPALYMRTCIDALRPGGVMYAYGPHGRHPFAACVRLVERFGSKRGLLDASGAGGNEYPAYYRLSTRRGLQQAVRGLPIDTLEIHYHPSMQWKCYFPGALRWVPWSYDRLFGVHTRTFAQQFFFKIEKAREAAPSDGSEGDARALLSEVRA